MAWTSNTRDDPHWQQPGMPEVPLAHKAPGRAGRPDEKAEEPVLEAEVD